MARLMMVLPTVLPASGNARMKSGRNGKVGIEQEMECPDRCPWADAI